MKLYLIEREEDNISVDEVIAYVICTENKIEALDISYDNSRDFYIEKNSLKTKSIGIAFKTTKKGIILESFNNA